MHSDTSDRVPRWPYLASALVGALALCALGLAAARVAETAAPSVRQEIPRVWDEAALREFQLPPPGTDIRSEHVPEGDYERIPIFHVSVETDPGLTLYTRRATGYCKVPSLRGLWYRERLFHDGSLSLDEVLDPARLEVDFVPSGFRGADTPSRPVPGHSFGLELDARERAALIAWLKTL